MDTINNSYDLNSHFNEHKVNLIGETHLNNKNLLIFEIEMEKLYKNFPDFFWEMTTPNIIIIAPIACNQTQSLPTMKRINIT